jgi:hypothetical protein
MHGKNWKKNVNKKTLYSLEYSISLGEDLNSDLPFPILAYLFLMFLAKLSTFANFLQ